MTWYRLTIPDYPYADIDAASPNQAVSKAVHSIYHAMPEGQRTIYFRDREYGYDRRKLLINALIDADATNFVEETTQVPSIVGMTLEDAEERLKERNLSLGKVVKKELLGGVVVKQDPEFGIRVPLDSKVNVITNLKKKRSVIEDLKRLASKLSAR